MPAISLSIEEFIGLSGQHPVLDVRSPGEYEHAHIPGAVSLPLFSDEERKVVGTSYKQESREQAIKHGLDYFGPKMRGMVEVVEELIAACPDPSSKTVLVHCWRGGMRSGAVAWLLDLYGFKVYLLEGGYKAFRNWVLSRFTLEHKLHIIGGYTGSGKTLVLYALREAGHATLDLEGIAHHKGSAFGGLGQKPQPSSEQFENVLAMQLYRIEKERPNDPIWIEDESQRIGNLNIPIELWNSFRTKPLYFLDVPFEARLDYLVKDYGSFPTENLINAIVRIKKRFGPNETKTAVNCLIEGDIKGAFELLLKYYDKHYAKALANRPQLNDVLINIPSDVVDEKGNAEKILSALGR